MQQYFYDKQLRRYIQQFIRLFSGFTVQMGVSDDKLPIFQQVPVRYGDISRMAAHIQRENSENITNTVPFISCYVTDLNMAPQRRADQQHVDKVQVFEKKVNPNTGKYENEVGNTYTVERHMPVPYNIIMNCDIWTSNTDQKMQLLEQILVLFNPTLDVRTSNNAFDWSSLAYVEMTNTIWSSRSIGNSVDDIIDVATLTFEIPVYINPPARVKHQRIIHTILNQLYQLDDEDLEAFKEQLPFDRSTVEFTVVTFEDRHLEFENNRAYITTPDGVRLKWKESLVPFGALRDNISQIRLRKSTDPGNTENDIIGRLTEDLTDPFALNVSIDTDTLPSNTLLPINGVVNPQQNYPGDGQMPIASAGDRYLLTDEVGISAWNVVAKENDIIEYTGSNWIVVFEASTNGIQQYVANLASQDQLRWDGSEWSNSYEGTYDPGYWRIHL
jgi:hypothetical protein